MKKSILLLLTLLTIFLPFAQAQSGDSWSIRLNKKVLLQTPIESAEPVIFLSKKEMLQGKGMITIMYQTKAPEDNWNRTFTLNDEGEKTAKRFEMNKQSGSVSFRVSDLKKAAVSNKALFLYTISLPNDPAMAATVRVRRFLLCKIQWKA